MAQDRITQIKNLLFLRETKHRLDNKTINYSAINQLIENGISGRVVFVSSNPLLLKATEHNIKGNVIMVLMNPITFLAFQRMVLPSKPDIIVFDKQTPKVDGFLDMLYLQGYEVYEY